MIKSNIQMVKKIGGGIRGPPKNWVILGAIQFQGYNFDSSPSLSHTPYLQKYLSPNRTRSSNKSIHPKSKKSSWTMFLKNPSKIWKIHPIIQEIWKIPGSFWFLFAACWETPAAQLAAARLATDGHHGGVCALGDHHLPVGLAA